MSTASNSLLATSESYITPEYRGTASFFPTIRFYISAFLTVSSSAILAKRGVFDGARWAEKSWDVLRALERSGVKVRMTGLEHLSAANGPAVIVANHMSTLETFVLPGIINPVMPCTFVIKPSLMDYPIFGHVMRSRNPIVVSRSNPRQDLVTVLEEGQKRLDSGISIVLFPQTTRRADFTPEEFNSLGVKLAKKAGVPVIPLALQTDAWQNGRHFKDFGKIDPARPVYFEFAAPITISGTGKEEHQQIVDFISSRYRTWSKE